MQQDAWLQAAHEVVALAGFHIKRQEFEPEYDNEAEMIVADMEFRDDDTEVGMHACTPLSCHEPKSIKINHLNDNHNADDTDNDCNSSNSSTNDNRKQQNLDRRRNPAEREMYARLKAVARYLPQQEFEVLSDGVVTETRLRTGIQVAPPFLWYAL